LNDSDCPEGRACSTARQCISDECISHADCEQSQRCASGRCVARPSVPAGIYFERVREPNLQAHLSKLPNVDQPRDDELDGEWGFGAALLDIDGDLDLDLFIGSQSASEDTGSPGCLYRNDSLPGSIRFTPMPGHCEFSSPQPYAAFATDIENDGFHELLLASYQHLILKRFYPAVESLDLIELIPEGSSRRNCLVGSLVNIDLNYDGRLDLYVGCQTEMLRDRSVSYYNLAFLQNSEGNFEYLNPDLWGAERSLLLKTNGNTLALGAADLNEDGLIDLIVSQDSVIRDHRMTTDPGGVYLRCSPREPCGFRSRPVSDDEESAFGALMGSGVIQVEGLGEQVYFTDFGSNRMIQIDEAPPVNSAASRRSDLTRIGRSLLFSWGVVVDDFNRDGRDDLYVSQGSVKSARLYDYNSHFDALLLQNAQGSFVWHGSDLGIEPFTTEDSGNETFPFASRATLKTDLDYDGHLDLVGLGMEGYPRLHREVPLTPAVEPRCTVIPMTRYAPGFGTGFALIQEGQAPRKWDSQGQLRSSASPFVVSPHNSANLRFPSGAVIPFNCQGTSGPMILVEPEWLHLSLNESLLTLRMTEARPEGELTVLIDPSGTLESVEFISENESRLQLPEQAQRVMLRFGSRWLPRWFTLAELSQQ
ncbi:MAG: FG-GAP-like repeat-containing protein, partial [Myxococcota bacterium]|nr:FG-GAP-like repeat-containing protein [Myxococcota bacterium]